VRELRAEVFALREIIKSGGGKHVRVQRALEDETRSYLDAMRDFLAR